MLAGYGTKDMKSKKKRQKFMKKTDSGHTMVPSLDITPKKVLSQRLKQEKEVIMNDINLFRV